MNFIIEYLKRASFIEILTILFFLSVGVSLTFKIGFYNALGVGWYIQNLTPQILFISSFKVILIFLGGIFVGCIFGLKFSERSVSVIFLCFIALYTSFNGFIQNLLSINLEISNYFDVVLFIFYFLTSMFLVSLGYKKRKYNDPLFVGPLIRIKREEVIFDNVFKIVIILLIFCLPYVSGYDAGKLVKNNKVNSVVVIKNDSRKWHLIDMSGDKVLLKEINPKRDVFKVLEYKDIDTITTR
ncbi:TPA: hypothetical protein JI398_RS05030 [Acinetobacter baumannii]|uniref:hypothetical protein n=1 Tax=Acinetobacter baumannii TaxID=470 RepID=UPI000348F304|nr:hypothetical protein [Acinetobacter baumannii]AKQ31238.1 hypothetical protein ACX61_12735 [Acinetobacter baumannii]EHU1798668.1 hypothetical protein [Acinetobacter baumannii]KAA8936476.1 hypothetical protein DLI75_19260 [Acinetobacter baumannii]KAA8940864.1 hypothetical protein DLI74_09005 [Acinetobacter baumannii]KMV13192.1 putative membrane protein [Acinetobacter baumannii]